MEKNDENGLIPSKLSFEDLKKMNQHGIEYWSARELQSILGYSKWQRFENSINKAIESCEQSGNDPKHHFTGAGKPIPGGKGATQTVEEYYLSRFACYLIAQNRLIILSDKSMRKYRANVPKNTRMVVDLSPGGAAYSSIRIKTRTFEDVAQSLSDWASASF